MLRRLSVKSKLLAAVLGVSISSILIVSIISFMQGQRALSDAVLENLTAQRESRTELIELYLDGIADQASTLSQDQSVASAAAQFAVAADQLVGAELAPEWSNASESFYEDFAAGLPQNDESFAVNGERYRPRDPVALYLQQLYVIGNDVPRSALSDAGDNSFYSRVHQRFHPSFRSFASRFGFYDVFIIEPEENRIVYSVEKEVDFGTSLSSGPWGRSSLADLVQSVKENPVQGAATFVDYQFYDPSNGEPAAFVAAPIFNDVNQQLLGILAFQLPLDEIDKAMTADGDWADAGFGDTGEAFLVARDEAMRSQSRLLTENPELYRERIIEAGSAPETADAILASQTSVLRQQVRTASAQNGLRGQTGTAVVTTYHGEVALSSYGPLELPDGLDWAIVTEQSLAEAERPVNDLQRSLLVATGLIVLILTALAMLFSSQFVRPINALTAWAGRVSEGEMDESPPVHGSDEIGQLGSSVQKMVSEMRTQSETIESQRSEMQALILNLMPPKIAERVTGGEASVADAYPNVTMIVAHLSGFSRFARSASPGDGKQVLDEVIGSFDEVAREAGVEKISGGSGGYVAAVGLMEPRLDQRQRAMQFAVAIDRKLESLSRINTWDLDLRVGVASGDVEAGIVGQRQISFEVWGDPVSDATALAENAPLGTVLVAADIAEALSERYRFEAADPVDADGDQIAAFRWIGEDD